MGARTNGANASAAGASRAKWLTLATVTFSLFMIMLDNTVVTVALPAIETGVRASLSQLEWVIDAYALTFAVLLLLGGKLADYLGRRRVFVAGLVVFTLSSLGCAIASSAGVLIAARSVQGAGAALMLPATISILSDAFEPHERGTAFGVWAAISGIALAVGPIVGGVIVEAAQWSWIFYINIPIGVVGLAATYRYVRESRDTTADQRLDLSGLLTSAGAMFGLTFALIEANAHGWGSAEIVLCFVGAGILLAAFVLIEMRAQTAMLDVALFRNAAFVGANAAGLLVMTALFGFIFFMSLYLQQIRSYSAIGAGGVFLVSTAAMTLVSPFAGKLADRVGGGLPIIVGLALFGASLVGISLMIGANTRLWTLFPLLFLGGIGFGLVLPPATTTVVGTVPPDKSGVASGLMQAMRQLGAAIGVAIAGALMSAKLGIFNPADVGYAARFVNGLQAVFLFTGLASIGGAVIAALLIPGRRGEGAVAEPAATRT